MIRQSAGKTRLSLAYLIGVYLGDGWMGYVKSNTGWFFRLNTIDADFAEAARAAIEELTGNKGHVCCHPVKKSSKPNYSLGIGAKNIAWIKSICHQKTKIPDIIYKMGRKEHLEFIAGIMDSEGYVSIHKDRKSASTIGVKAVDGWIKDFYHFCRKFGLKIGKLGQEKIKSGKTAYRFIFNHRSWIDNGCYFKIKRKQDKVCILRDYMPNTH